MKSKLSDLRPSSKAAIIAKIKEMRESSQIMDDECGSSTPVIKKKTDGNTNVKATAELYFKSPQRFDECRLCIEGKRIGTFQRNIQFIGIFCFLSTE